MYKRLICFILPVFIAAVCLLGCTYTHVDNNLSADALLSKHYNQEQFFTIQAIYNVQKSFHPVAAEYLCDYENMRLECKREIENGFDYYVLAGKTIRCFLFVDDEDNVENIVVVYRFPSVEDVRSRSGSNTPFGAFPNFDDYRSSINLRESNNETDTLVFFCSDGVVVARDIGGDSFALDTYTDEAWEDCFTEFGGYLILGIDKNAVSPSQ